LPTPASPSSFLTGTAVPTGCRPPPTFAGGFILSELRSSPEYCSSGPAPSRPCGLSGAPPLGFLSLIAASAGSVLCEASRALHRPSSAFLTPSTVSSATGLVGLFHPTATSRVLPPGVCSPRPARFSRRERVPSRRCRRDATDGCPPAPRPVASASGPCSGCGSVVLASAVSRCMDPIPSWDFSSSRFSVSSSWGLATPPLMAFRKKPLGLASRCPLP